MQVYVELPEELDVPEWTRRHARGEVPDATPYGLHYIEDVDVRVGYRHPLRRRGPAWLAAKVRGRLDSTEVVAAVLGAGTRNRRDADAVLCMDERTGLPAALLPGGPLVVSGVAWLEDPARLRRAHAMLARRALRRMAAVFTQSPAMVPVLCEAWDVPPERVHEITLGIDPAFYPAQPWPECPGVVASVGDDRMRDHRLLVEAMRRIRDGGMPARLELATTLPVALPPELGVLHNRRMGAAMREVYRRSSVVAVALHPNVVGSGLTVVLEAQASGRPIVVTGNSGMDRYIEHGVTGLLVEPGNPAAFADAVGSLLADPQRAAAMGRAGRAAVEEHYSTSRMAQQLRAMLLETVSAQGH